MNPSANYNLLQPMTQTLNIKPRKQKIINKERIKDTEGEENET
jgi:hypothetical protein